MFIKKWISETLIWLKLGSKVHGLLSKNNQTMISFIFICVGQFLKIEKWSIPILELEFIFLRDTVGHLLCPQKILISVFEGNKGFLMENTVIHLGIFVFNFLNLFSPESDVEWFGPVQPIRWLLFSTDFLNFFKQDSVFPLDLCVLALQKIMLFWILLKQCLVRFNLRLTQALLPLFQTKILQLFAVKVHPVSYLLLLEGVLERNRWQLLSTHILILLSINNQYQNIIFCQSLTNLKKFAYKRPALS